MPPLSTMTGVIWLFLSIFILIGAFNKYPSSVQQIFDKSTIINKKWLAAIAIYFFFIGVYKLV